VNYGIPSPPVEQHYRNLEVALQTIQESTKEYGYAPTTLRSKRKGGEAHKAYLQCDRGKPRPDHTAAEQNRRRMKGSRCLNCTFCATLLSKVVVVADRVANKSAGQPISEPEVQRGRGGGGTGSGRGGIPEGCYIIFMCKST